MNKLVRQNDLKEIDRYYRNDPSAQILREFFSWKDFKIGDVLIKRDKQNEGAVIQVSETCQVPKKYKIIHIDQLGIPWVKQVSVRGGLGKKLYALLDMSPTRYSFEIDPQKFDAEILGYKYDPRIEYKRMRDINPDYGKDED